MTQLTLFDSSTTAVADLPQAATSSSASSAAKTVKSTVSKTASSATAIHRQEPATPPNSNDNDLGVQRMGDLARAVLMRYELVAKRRAMFEARLAAKRNQAKAKCKQAKAKAK